MYCLACSLVPYTPKMKSIFICDTEFKYILQHFKHSIHFEVCTFAEFPYSCYAWIVHTEWILIYAIQLLYFYIRTIKLELHVPVCRSHKPSCHDSCAVVYSMLRRYVVTRSNTLLELLPSKVKSKIAKYYKFCNHYFSVFG